MGAACNGAGYPMPVGGRSPTRKSRHHQRHHRSHEQKNTHRLKRSIPRFSPRIARPVWACQEAVPRVDSTRGQALSESPLHAEMSEPWGRRSARPTLEMIGLFVPDLDVRASRSCPRLSIREEIAWDCFRSPYEDRTPHAYVQIESMQHEEKWLQVRKLLEPWNKSTRRSKMGIQQKWSSSR